MTFAETTRLNCFEIATLICRSNDNVAGAADEMANWVDSDELRLASLKLAYGSRTGITSTKMLLAVAETVVKYVRPEAPPKKPDLTDTKPSGTTSTSAQKQKKGMRRKK